MKERILTGWTFRRAVYLAIGILVIVQAVMQQQWPAVLFGGYFAAMGLFGFGCAAGNCAGGNCSAIPTQKTTTPGAGCEDSRSSLKI